MKNIWLNILAFVAFLAIEITAVSLMSTYSVGSAAMAGCACARDRRRLHGSARQRYREHQALIPFYFAIFHPFLFFLPGSRE